MIDLSQTKQYLIDQLHELGLTFRDIHPIRAEASMRSFYRIVMGDDTLVAMVYPEPAAEEIQRIIDFTALYKAHGLNVPDIEERIGDRVLLQQDLGNLMFQKSYSKSSRKGDTQPRMLDKVADMLIKLKEIPPENTAAVLGTSRLKWELDFFLTHFAAIYLEEAGTQEKAEAFRLCLHRLAESIGPIDTFAHRDFHSRNMQVLSREIYLVDFQDSLVASPYYDLVSFAFDAYMDLGIKRDYFLHQLKERGMEIDEEQYYLAALQRNIKALGTFGFQVNRRRHLSYGRYIPRTLRHIRDNKLYDRFFTPAYFNYL